MVFFVRSSAIILAQVLFYQFQWHGCLNRQFEIMKMAIYAYRIHICFFYTLVNFELLIV
jgi:hypothetical protein